MIFYTLNKWNFLCSKLNIDNCFFMILYIFTTIRLFLLSVHEIRIDAQKEASKIAGFFCADLSVEKRILRPFLLY